MWAKIQTMKETYQRILENDRPWNALGDFTNYWYAYAKRRHPSMVKDPIELQEDLTLEQQRWGAFCAAATEWFCLTYHHRCPRWVRDQRFKLDDPWYMGLGSDLAEVQQRLRQETPSPFRERNIFCPLHVFANKYEGADRFRALRKQHEGQRHTA